jgi:hypothetical protein
MMPDFVAHLDTLSYQEGMPLSTIVKTMLVDYICDEHSSHCHIYMVEWKVKATRTPTSYPSKSPGTRAQPMLAMRTMPSAMPTD